MDFFRKLGQQLGQVWQGLGAGRQAALLAGGVVCLGLMAAVWYWAGQAEYGVLFAGLAPEDAGAITSKLQTMGVPFRLASGGTTVLVPADQVHQKRIEMAVEGLPAKGGKGFELFDSSPLGMTPFTQHINYMRALQAELAKTISQIEPVVDARVLIVRPDPSPFVRDQKPTTASVMVRLRAGATLNHKVAMGIVALVSKSVEGLTADNVTLVDANGRMLSDPEGKEGGGSISSQMDYRRELESYLGSKAEGMLSQVLGPGRAIVRVTADINFQRQHKKEETYSPDGRVAISEAVTSSKSSGSSQGARGPTGTTSNQAKQPASTTGGANNNQDETIKTDFVVSKVTQEFEDKLGAVERLTVAAMIDLSTAEAAKGGASPSFTLAEAQDIIKKAVGFKTNRGDEIKVSNVKLTPPPPLDSRDNEPDPMQYWLRIISLVRNGSLGLAALVALVLGWLVLRQFRRSGQANASSSAATRNDAAPQQRIVSMIEQNPEIVAKVLANWLDQPDRQRKAA